MVARQPGDHEVGKLALTVPARDGIGDDSRAQRVRDAEHEPRVGWGGDIRQARDVGPHAARHPGVALFGLRLGHLAEVHHPQPLPLRRVPQIGVPRIGQVLAARQIPFPPVGVYLRPGLLVVVAGERPIGPLVTVGGDLAVHVEVVEQHPATGDGMGVGRHRVVEDGQTPVAVPFCHVPEHLVVGPILADHVHDMADGGTGGRAVRYGPQARVRVRTERVHLTGVAGQRGGVGDRDDGKRPGDHVADVLVVGVRARAAALAVRHVQRSAVGRRGHGGRVPARGNQSGDAHAVRAEPDDGDRIAARHRDIERAAVR